MRKWMREDWEFTVSVTGSDTENCRCGMEKGDVFTFQYGCPADFCPRAMAEIYTWCEVVRCGGDFLHRGCREPYTMELPCPCRVVTFRLHACPIHRDASGRYIGEDAPT